MGYTVFVQVNVQIESHSAGRKLSSTKAQQRLKRCVPSTSTCLRCNAYRDVNVLGVSRHLST